MIYKNKKKEVVWFFFIIKYTNKLTDTKLKDLHNEILDIYKLVVVHIIIFITPLIGYSSNKLHECKTNDEWVNYIILTTMNRARHVYWF